MNTGIEKSSKFPYTLQQECWLKALEGDAFKKTRCMLQDNSGYCCLGVGCEIAKSYGVVVNMDKVGSIGSTYRSEFISGVNLAHQLSVLEFLKLRDVGGTPSRVPNTDINKIKEFTHKKIRRVRIDFSLVRLNDEVELPFHLIAKIIRDDPDAYFTNLDK